MATLKSKLLATAAAVPLTMFAAGGAALVLTAGSTTPTNASCAANPCAAKKPAACNPCNPCAAKKASACNPCNPCAAKAACNPCNPCAAKKASACNPCNPCAAAACNPCNPCAASAGLAATECYVPRLWNASACNPCNPCAAKKASACNPCNPCAAKAACNPCNPCAAKAACNPCNPCAAKKASACNPCNPCAAKKASACNPCNPCAAKNPCAASACSPCNPCAASAAADPEDLALTGDEVTALYDCLSKTIEAQYMGGGHWAVDKWAGYESVTKHAYPSATHGNRFVVNFVNDIGAAAYKKYEEIGKAPPGSTIAKPSFVVNARGQASFGPLFIMEKMTAGFNPDTGDWRYATIMPGGATMGVTKGENAAAMGFCHECHAGAEDADFLFFLPEDVRM